MEPRQLPKGKPDGSSPIRQSKRGSAVTAIVSEYSKRVAHELDDKHHKWIMVRRDDSLQYSLGSEPEPEPTYLIRPNHVAMLGDYENIEENYQKMTESRRRLEVRLTKENSDKARLINTYSASRFFAHINAIKAELAYVESVQIRLKELRNHVRSVLKDATVTEQLGLEPSVAVLGELLGIVQPALSSNDIGVLRQGVHGNNERLRNKIANILRRAEQQITTDTDKRVLVDGFIAQQWEIKNESQ